MLGTHVWRPSAFLAPQGLGKCFCCPQTSWGSFYYSRTQS
jgi:hypothetical protein